MNQLNDQMKTKLLKALKTVKVNLADYTNMSVMVVLMRFPIVLKRI